MLPTVFGAIVVILGLYSQFGSPARAIVIMFGLTVFGAASALDLPALGGASVAPANLFLVFYGLRLLGTANGLRRLLNEITPGQPLFLFLILILWVVTSALILPRAFDGSIYVFSLSRSESNDGDLLPLHLSGGNISQMVYALGGFGAACLTAAYMRWSTSVAAFVAAITFCTTLHLAFAFLDVVTGATHTGFLLDPIHTASYSFLTTDELGGLKRISGSFSEASAFAAYSLTLLSVNFTLFVLKVRPLLTGAASLLLTGFIAAATSSAGYVGLVTFFTAFLVYAVATALFRGRTRPLFIAFCSIAGLVALSGLVIMFVPTVADIAQTVVTDSLLTKSNSDSAVERGMMNTQAWQVFKDTSGVGAGIGSTRASNYALVLLSNLGLPGFCLFVALLLALVFGRLESGLSREVHAVVWAARVGIVTTLIPSLLAGTVYDLGTLFYGLVGIASGGVGRRQASPGERLAASATVPSTIVAGSMPGGATAGS